MRLSQQAQRKSAPSRQASSDRHKCVAGSGCEFQTIKLVFGSLSGITTFLAFDQSIQQHSGQFSGQHLADKTYHPNPLASELQINRKDSHCNESSCFCMQPLLEILQTLLNNIKLPVK